MYIYIYIVEHNKCSDMANSFCSDACCSKKSSSALLFQQQQASQQRCLLNRHSTVKCLWLKKWNIYVNISRMCKASNYLKMTHKRLYLSTALLFALNINNHRFKIVEHSKCSDSLLFLNK